MSRKRLFGSAFRFAPNQVPVASGLVTRGQLVQFVLSDQASNATKGRPFPQDLQALLIEAEIYSMSISI